ncbi:adenosine kinase [Marinomonas sp. 2405UD68-3]|uniref:adenosine kinase n=1 Tax=Marinomonas sp. 2405UD68-3 TaxID=3391835 RepID=UPI0039C9C23E
MKQYDLYGIGNALVDIEASTTEVFLSDNNVIKGCMSLVDASRQNHLLSNLRSQIEHKSCGGSVANSTIATANFGGNCFFSCVVADDEMGRFFHRDLHHKKIDTNLDSQPLISGNTGTCLAMITPDADRTMNTFLGVGGLVGIQHINENAAAQSKVIFLEGYLISSDSGLAAMQHLIDISKSNKSICAISLSDPMLVKSFRNRFIDMIKSGIDLIFMNEEEAFALSETRSIDEAFNWLRQNCSTFIITCGKEGCVGWDGKQKLHTRAQKINKLDTIGAGDMYAGSFIYAIIKGLSYQEAAEIACYCASLIVGQYGPRFESKNLKKAKLFLENYQQLTA